MENKSLYAIYKNYNVSKKAYIRILLINFLNYRLK